VEEEVEEEGRCCIKESGI